MESDYEKLVKVFESGLSLRGKVKTKHLVKKAAKKVQVKVTRATKRQKANKLDSLREDITRKIEYMLSHLRQTNASDCEAISFLKNKHAKLRQLISE